MTHSDLTVLDIDHLGLVAGLIDELGLVEHINQRLGSHHLNDDRLGRVLDQLYQAGLTSFLDVLDAERTLLQAQDQLARDRTYTLVPIPGDSA